MLLVNSDEMVTSAKKASSAAGSRLIGLPSTIALEGSAPPLRRPPARFFSAGPSPVSGYETGTAQRLRRGTKHHPYNLLKFREYLVSPAGIESATF